MKKFYLFCKNLNNQATSGKPKTGFEGKRQAIEANLEGSTQRVSCELNISKSSVIHHPDDLSKRCQLCLTLQKYCKTFDSTQ